MIALKLNQPRIKHPPGVRPLSLRHDVPAVTSLLELVFHQHLGSAGRRALTPTYLDSLRLLRRDGAVPGFVYEDRQGIIGNVSLLESRQKGRYLVANVAVHPDFRRQGIARQMMGHVLEYIISREGTLIALQVEEDNEAAIRLYRRLGFTAVGTTNVWHLNFYNLRPVAYPRGASSRNPDRFPHFQLRPLRNQDAAEAFELDARTFPLALQWPDPANHASYRRDWLQRLNNLVNGRVQESWVAALYEGDSRLVGIGVLESEWGRPHTLKLRSDENWDQDVYRALLAKLTRRLRHMSRRPVILDQRKPNIYLEDLLTEAGFHRKRSLTTMQLHLVA